MPTPPSLAAIRKALRRDASPTRAAFVARYFKTAPGDYSHGDKFLGLTVPQLRKVARDAQHLSLADVSRLLDSAWHEERMLALLVLVRQFSRGSAVQRRQIFQLYLRRRRQINNWDLVDLSAGSILGPYLGEPRGARVRRLATSTNVWDRRMAILATFHEIRQGRYAETFDAAERLLHDRHDLIHKAVGWLLREVGNRDPAAERRFLDRHAATMPRTMLRYAVERFPSDLKRHYMGVRAKS